MDEITVGYLAGCRDTLHKGLMLLRDYDSYCEQNGMLPDLDGFRLWLTLEIELYER